MNGHQVALPAFVLDLEIRDLARRLGLPVVASPGHCLLQRRCGGKVEAESCPVASVHWFHEDRRAVLGTGTRRPEPEAAAIETDSSHQRAELLAADARRKADSLDAWISFPQLQPGHEPVKLGAVDFVVRREQYRAGAHDLEVHVQAHLNLATGLLRIGKEFGARSGLGGRRGAQGQAGSGRHREATGEDEQAVRHRSPKKEPAQRRLGTPSLLHWTIGPGSADSRRWTYCGRGGEGYIPISARSAHTLGLSPSQRPQKGLTLPVSRVGNRDFGDQNSCPSRTSWRSCGDWLKSSSSRRSSLVTSIGLVR